MSTRAAGYTRVSTGKQRDDGVSLEVQEQRIRARCIDKGWPLTHIYTDPGMSGADWDRPGFNQMLQAAERRQFNVLLFYDSSRLARDLEYLRFSIRKLKGAGVEFDCLTRAFGTDTPEDMLHVNMEGGLDEYLRAKIGRATAAGMQLLTERGAWHGRAPYGYHYQASEKKGENTLVVHPQEAAIVLECYEQYLRGASYDDLRPLFNGDGVRASDFFLRRLLTRPTYIGMIRWNGELYSGRHEAIVPRDLWEGVQGKIDRHTRGWRTRKYLLSGMLHCPRCDVTMSAKPQYRQASFSYVCDCGERIGGQRMHQCLYRFLDALPNAPNHIIRGLPAAAGPNGKVRASLERQLANIPKARQRLIDDWRNPELQEALGAEEFATSLKALDGKRGDLQAQLAALDENPVLDPEQTRNRFASLREMLESDVGLTEKRDILSDVFAHISYEKRPDDTILLCAVRLP